MTGFAPGCYGASRRRRTAELSFADSPIAGVPSSKRTLPPHSRRNTRSSGSARSVVEPSGRFAGLPVAEAGQNGGCCFAHELALVLQCTFEVADHAGILPASERGRRHDTHGGIRVFEGRREGL